MDRMGKLIAMKIKKFTVHVPWDDLLKILCFPKNILGIIRCSSMKITDRKLSTTDTKGKFMAMKTNKFIVYSE